MMNNMNRAGLAGFMMLLLAFSVTEAKSNSKMSNTGEAVDEYQIHVNAGAFDRSGTVVSFFLPDDLGEGLYPMIGPDGDTVIVQVDSNNTGWFVLDQLSAGETRIYTFHTDVAIDTDEAVSFELDDRTISFQAGNRPVLSYYHSDNEPPEVLDDRYRRGGYIHPVYSPSGVVLTNHLNPDQHPHHSGIWSAWTNTRFEEHTPDFWNVHNNTGRVDVDSMRASWSGPVHAGLRSTHRFTDLSAEDPVVALNEEWEVRVFRIPNQNLVHVFDLKVTQTVNTGKPLILPEYRYGGVGFRGHKDWDDPENATFLTSGGLGRDGHATRARWSHIGGHSEGELAGIAIMGHPANYRFPQPMRIHPNEPFFNYAPTQLGEMSIEPGSPYVVKYRYVTYDGEPDVDLIERMWQDYAYPPGVTVK